MDDYTELIDRLKEIDRKKNILQGRLDSAREELAECGIKNTKRARKELKKLKEKQRVIKKILKKKKRELKESYELD